MGMLDFLGRDTGEYVAGSLKQGGVGALGDIASRQAFGLVSGMIPQASDPTIEAGSVAALALITGGLVERFVPPLQGLGQAWAAVPVANALTALATRLTGFDLSGGVGLLNAYATPEQVGHATVGELDHYASMATPDPARNLAGVV
ncbi:hypothetical protein HN937_24460 [Candidatus Poribacteria bacterium]|jgi:hypothetical protein|nr:hypothetical protein [Candidatus Poribacteria bacterium]